MRKIFFTAILVFALSLTSQVSAQILPGEELESLAISEVERVLSERGESRRREINTMQRLTGVKLPEGQIDVRISMPTSINYVGVTPVRARIFINGKVYRDVNIAMTVRVFDNVIIANHDLRIDVAFSEADFRLAEVAIDGRNEFVKNFADIKGLVPLRYITAGSPVTKNYFQTPVVVEYNQPIRIIVRHNGLQVSAKGFALSRGRIGQMIKIKNESSQKIVSARIIDANTAEVTY